MLYILTVISKMLCRQLSAGQSRCAENGNMSMSKTVSGSYDGNDR